MKHNKYQNQKCLVCLLCDADNWDINPQISDMSDIFIRTRTSDMFLMNSVEEAIKRFTKDVYITDVFIKDGILFIMNSYYGGPTIFKLGIFTKKGYEIYQKYKKTYNITFPRRKIDDILNNTNVHINIFEKIKTLF